MKAVPGLVRVVSKGNYVAVVCEREEHAIQAARQLKVEWKKPATAPFPTSENLFDYMRSAMPTSMGMPTVAGNLDAAMASSAKRVEAEYEVPFQGHVAIGPAHAMADPSNGQMTIYSNDMKSYGLRDGVARFLDMPRDRVRVVWMEGPQAYGRTAADDAGFEAAFLAKEIGRPVRVQWMRNEETAWDTKGPAFTVKMRGGLDAQGNLTAMEFEARAADHNHLGYNEPDSVLIAQLTGQRKADAGAGRRRVAGRAVLHPEPPLRGARGGAAAGLGDAAAHRQPARSQRPAGGVRVRVVHGRTGGGCRRRPDRLPPEAADRQHHRRQRLQARALDCRREGRGGEVRLGRAAVAQACGRPARC